MDCVYVVPSYNRPDAFKTKTLATLQYHKIPSDKIYLFVANDDQKEKYITALGDESICNIIVGIIGLPAVRNFIFNHFPINQKIVSFDDDVSGFVKLKDDKLQLLESQELLEVIETGFNTCDTVGAKFWGDYPVANAFFMKNTISIDLKFIMGSFWGCYNPGSEIEITIGNGEKEDILRTILFWIRDKKIVRLNYIAHKTKIYSGTGGLQSDGVDTRIKRENETVDKLLEMYPQYIRRNTRRKSNFPELSFIKQK